MREDTNVEVDELVTLSKYDGDVQEPKFEVERLTIHNGVVVSHDVIKDGEVVAPVENSDIVGSNIGRLVPLEGR